MQSSQYDTEGYTIEYIVKSPWFNDFFSALSAFFITNYVEKNTKKIVKSLLLIFFQFFQTCKLFFFREAFLDNFETEIYNDLKGIIALKLKIRIKIQM